MAVNTATTGITLKNVVHEIWALKATDTR